MRKFLNNRNGAVTVFVTLLLIPAILLSGTGVDISRMYTAKSILQDANQLAVNSMLAEYDALLQDLYGLFAVTEEDEELKKLVNKYIKTAIYTSDGDQGGAGVFKLFYGSSDPNVTVDFEEDQDLGDVDTIRRQIEEYAKLRAPVIIAEELLDRLDDFKKVNADAEIIDDKIAIEDKLEEIDKYYENIYKTIKTLDDFPEKEDNILGTVNFRVNWIRVDLCILLDVRDEYTIAVKNGNEKDAVDAKKRFEGLRSNVLALINGGTYVEDWNKDTQSWNDKGRILSLQSLANNASDRIKKCKGNTSAFFWGTETLADLQHYCTEADKANAKLREMITDLRIKLEESECHDELKESLGDPGGLLDQYEQLVQYDLKKLGDEVYEAGVNHIDALVKKLRDVNSLNGMTSQENSTFKKYTFSQLYDTVNGMKVDLDVINDEHRDKGEETEPDPLVALGDERRSTMLLNAPDSTFRKWSDFDNGQKEFYESLKKLYEGANSDGESKKDAKKKARASVTQIFKTLQDLFAGLKVDPEGAKSFSNSGATYADKANSSSGTDFGKGTDWGSENAAKNELRSALKGDFIKTLSNAGNSLANKAILLGYASEMFSSYTTESGEKNMAGIPMSTDVNYYFQSELEYIYNGNLNDAVKNHNAVGSLILLVRFIFNYIAAFSINEVNSFVSIVEAGLAWLGPFGVAIAELGRMGIALGESLVDLSLLRTGHKVALLKTNETWKFSLSGIANVTSDVVEAAVNKGENSADDGLDSATGVYYADYLHLFLLLVDGDTMAKRIGQLIEINMTNKIQKINAKEDAMAKAALFDMSAAKTGFTVTTTVEMSMMFLSMPFAQKGINGVVPPKSISISATDYRGY